ncbi:mCG1029119, partial [Mus musculus]
RLTFPDYASPAMGRGSRILPFTTHWPHKQACSCLCRPAESLSSAYPDYTPASRPELGCSCRFFRRIPAPLYSTLWYKMKESVLSLDITNIPSSGMEHSLKRRASILTRYTEWRLHLDLSGMALHGQETT